MAILHIYDVNQPCLRARARKVTRVTDAERRVLDDMLETMRAAGGIGLAGPQVGILQRLIVIEIEDDVYTLINPEIVEFSEERVILKEGCLSLPNYFGPVERPTRVTVRALDRSGKKLKIKADEWLARVLQHEIDHLDGILFFDPQRMRSLDDLQWEDPDAKEKEDGEEGGQSASEESGRARADSKTPVTRSQTMSEPMTNDPSIVSPHEDLTGPLL